MTMLVYTTARPRRIPFFTFDQFLDNPIRSVVGSAANNPATLPKPSCHDALWKRGRGTEMPEKLKVMGKR